MYIEWRIERTPYEGNVYKTADTEVINGFYSPSVRVALGSQKDSFQFILSNNNDIWSGHFNNMDKIKIYRKKNSTSFVDDDLLMIGVIDSIQENRTSKGASITIKGYNYTEAVLNALITVDPATLTIPYALKAGLEAIKGDSPTTFPIEWDTSNPMLKQDGTAFPVVGDQWFNTTFISKLETYSQNNKTEDGRYMYWVDENNKFIWRPRTTSVDYSFDQTVDKFLSVKPTIDKTEIINWVQMQGGNDPKGSPIDEEVVDEASKAKYGVKYDFNTSEASYASTLNAQDIFDIGGTDFDGTLPSDVSGFSYPHSFAWQTDGSVCTSASDYINKFRLYVKAYLKIRGEAIIAIGKGGKQKLDYTLNAEERDWGIGDNVSIAYFNKGVLDGKILRVNSIQYTTTTDVFQLKEDTGSV